MIILLFIPTNKRPENLKIDAHDVFSSNYWLLRINMI